MKPVLAAIAVVAAGVAGAVAAEAGRESAAQGPRLFSAPRSVYLYGHVRSLRRSGAHYVLRFDPAFWLHGQTAKRAAVEDKAIAPGEAVSDDYYVVDEGRRVLTFRVPAAARASVVTQAQQGLRSTRVSVAELAQIVRGKNPKRRRLMATKFGFWISVTTDTVAALDQQYQP